MKRLYVFLCVMMWAVPVSGQTHLNWDQAATTLTEVQSFAFACMIDTAAPVMLTGVSCSGSGPLFACQSPMIPFSLGVLHSMTCTATSGGLTSLPSIPLVFGFGGPPMIPTNLHPKASRSSRWKALLLLARR